MHVFVPKLKFKASVEYWLRLLIENYYLIAILFYMLTFVHQYLPVGILSAIVMCIILAGMILKYGIRLKGSMVSMLAAIYVIYCVATVIFYFVEKIPFSVFIKSASNSLLPILFFWCGLKGYHFSNKRYLLAVNICGLTGIFLLFLRPSWFVQYCISYGYSFTRLSSCIGSTAMGTLTAVAIVYSVQQIIDAKGKSGKIAYILSVAYTFLSFQRSAWIVAALTIFVLHYYVFIKWRKLKMRYMALEILVILVCLVIFWEYIGGVLGQYSAQRASSSNVGMFSSRTGQWVYGLKNSNWIAGSGYGARGHKAMGYGAAAIADGSWVMLLCEIGIIGISIFIAIIIKTFGKGLYCLRSNLGALCVIAIICLQSVGSNILEFQITTPLLWMSIGEIAASARRLNKNESISYLSAPIP